MSAMTFRAISYSILILFAGDRAATAQVPAVGGSSVSQDPFNGGGIRMMGGMGGGPVGVAPTNLNGFGLFSVSGFGGYATYPSFDLVASKFGSIGSSIAGASASMGYGKVDGERTRFSIVYTPGFIARPQDLSRSRLNHSLGVNLSHGISPRLSLVLGIRASYSEFDQYAFSPAQFSLVTSAPGSFDDLASAITGGQYSNSQIASLLTGAPVLESAARASLYGNQALTANASIRLNYQATSRLSIGFNLGANRYQSVGKTGDDLGRAAAVPISNGLNAGLNLNYALTQKTSIGANLIMTRTVSRFVETSFITYTGNVAQRIGQRALVSISGGSGNALQSKTNVILNNRYLLNGSLALQTTPTQTLMVQVGRTFVDQFGLGVHSTQTVSGGWSYAPLGSPWSTTVSVGYQDSSISSANGLKALFASLSAGRNIGPNFGLSGGFFYSRSNNTLGAATFGASTQGEFERTGVRAVITWFPKPIEY